MRFTSEQRLDDGVLERELLRDLPRPPANPYMDACEGGERLTDGRTWRCGLGTGTGAVGT
jgi:hypothetical protein